MVVELKRPYLLEENLYISDRDLGRHEEGYTPLCLGMKIILGTAQDWEVNPDKNEIVRGAIMPMINLLIDRRTGDADLAYQTLLEGYLSYLKVSESESPFTGEKTLVVSFRCSRPELIGGRNEITPLDMVTWTLLNDRHFSKAMGYAAIEFHSEDSEVMADCMGSIRTLLSTKTAEQLITRIENTQKRDQLNATIGMNQALNQIVDAFDKELQEDRASNLAVARITTDASKKKNLLAEVDEIESKLARLPNVRRLLQSKVLQDQVALGFGGQPQQYPSDPLVQEILNRFVASRRNRGQ